MAFENFTIRQFMRGWFNHDYSEFSKEQFDQCYSEYIDTTGAYISDQFEKIVYIKFLTNRINTVNVFIRLQRSFIEEFGIAYSKSFYILEQYGYFLKWKDKESFLKELNDIEIDEKSTISDLEISVKALQEAKEREPQKEEQTEKQKREAFIRTVNSLGKIGYIIDNDKTTVEELAIIIKQQKEEYLKSKDGR